MIKKVIKSCKIYDHINILQESRDIHYDPRLGLKELNLDYSLRIWSQSVSIVCNSSVLQANHECPSIMYEFPLSRNLCKPAEKIEICINIQTTIRTKIYLKKKNEYLKGFHTFGETICHNCHRRLFFRLHNLKSQ